MALHRPLLRPLPPAWRNLKLGMPKRIGLMVEPTPFIHVSGYSNRFNEMLKYLNKAGDDVEIVTPLGADHGARLHREQHPRYQVPPLPTDHHR